MIKPKIVAKFTTFDVAIEHDVLMWQSNVYLNCWLETCKVDVSTIV